MTDKTGGPAFPYSALQPGGPTMYADSEGMTLRDYFAARVLQGFIRDEFLTPSYDDIAAACYEMADAMLKAREQ